MLAHICVSLTYCLLSLAPNGAFNSLCSFNYLIMSTSLKTRVLTNGKSTWRLTRFSDELFIAKGAFGKQYTFRCTAEVNNFEDFLVSKGFALRETGRYNNAIVRHEAVA